MDEHNTDIHELSGTSLEFRTQLAKQLEELVPEAIADGKVDIAKLKELPQEDAVIRISSTPTTFRKGYSTTRNTIETIPK